MHNALHHINRLGADYEAVQNNAGWAEIPSGVLRTSGPERVQWLHKLITADVEHLAAGQGVRAALLNAKGHFVAPFLVIPLLDSIILLAERDLELDLLNSLRRYVFREKVKLDSETGKWSLYSILGKESDQLTEQVFHLHAPSDPYNFTSSPSMEGALFIRGSRAIWPTTDILVPSTQREKFSAMLSGMAHLSDETLDLLRIEAGQPRWGVDFDSTSLALEIPEVLSIRVDQGCYVGQEVVARLVHRGHVNRQLVGLRLDSNEIPGSGDPINWSGKLVGNVTSAAMSPRLGGLALAYVRREAAEPGTFVQVNNRLTAKIALLPFAKE